MWSLHTDCSVWENLSFRNTFKTLQLHLPEQEDVVCGIMWSLDSGDRVDHAVQHQINSFTISK